MGEMQGVVHFPHKNTPQNLYLKCQNTISYPLQFGLKALRKKLTTFDLQHGTFYAPLRLE